MHKRHRTISLLIMPLVIFFWFFGWSLYWIGSTKKCAEPHIRDRIENLTFTVLVPEQKYAK